MTSVSTGSPGNANKMMQALIKMQSDKKVALALGNTEKPGVTLVLEKLAKYQVEESSG